MCMPLRLLGGVGAGPRRGRRGLQISGFGPSSRTAKPADAGAPSRRSSRAKIVLPARGKAEPSGVAGKVQPARQVSEPMRYSGDRRNFRAGSDWRSQVDTGRKRARAIPPEVRQSRAWSAAWPGLTSGRTRLVVLSARQSATVWRGWQRPAARRVSEPNRHSGDRRHFRAKSDWRSQVDTGRK